MLHHKDANVRRPCTFIVQLRTRTNKHQQQKREWQVINAALAFAINDQLGKQRPRHYKKKRATVLQPRVTTLQPT